VTFTVRAIWLWGMTSPIHILQVSNSNTNTETTVLPEEVYRGFSQFLGQNVGIILKLKYSPIYRLQMFITVSTAVGAAEAMVK
jgi:hypothetical protein